MQNQHVPVLIFAQSGRFLAQSASQAGYRVWVADCFGDQDTLAIADRWQQLEPIHDLTEQQILIAFSILSQGENCLLVYGSGIECHYSILNKLPANIKLIGNTAATISALQTPSTFFPLLKKLDLNYPDTQFEQAPSNDWLIKSSSGFGGSHIQKITPPKQRQHYYQRYITGVSGSGLFLANGKQAQLLSINQQYLQPCEASPFRLGGIISPWHISQQHQDYIVLTIHKIISTINLQGLNSIDFIISEQGQLFLLEINTRISASAELLASKIPLFQLHIDACNGLLPVIFSGQSLSLSGLHYLYADDDVLIPSGMNWPIECHDIPKTGVKIKRNEPICTLRLQDESVEILQKCCNDISAEITLQL